MQFPVDVRTAFKTVTDSFIKTTNGLHVVELVPHSQLETLAQENGHHNSSIVPHKTRKRSSSMSQDSDKIVPPKRSPITKRPRHISMTAEDHHRHSQIVVYNGPDSLLGQGIQTRLANALSHYSFAYSNGFGLFIGMEGYRKHDGAYVFGNDPTVFTNDWHIYEHPIGKDWGPIGIYMFFNSHTCHPICSETQTMGFSPPISEEIRELIEKNPPNLHNWTEDMIKEFKMLVTNSSPQSPRWLECQRGLFSNAV